MSVTLKNITLSVFINQLNLIMLGFLQNLLLRNIFLSFEKKKSYNPWHNEIYYQYYYKTK